jgi:hypothetical protein
MSSGDIESRQSSDGLPVASETAAEAGAGLPPEGEQVPRDPAEVTYAAVVQVRQASPLPPPRVGTSNLPLGDLDPEVLERLLAEMIKRRLNRGAHFYGRRGQAQYGLDIVERETEDARGVYQVRRYDVLTPGKITSAVTEYAIKPAKPGEEKPTRRFDAYRYVLATSAEFETDTALQDTLEDLQDEYVGDLVIEVWGREMLSSMLRDMGSLVYSVFGPEGAQSFCGFSPAPSGPGDPDPLGLVENPVQVLNLDAMATDARTLETGSPLESARLYGLIAGTLQEANFPVHAAGQRRRQAQLLRAGGDNPGAFAILWDLAKIHFTAGAASKFGSVYGDLEVLRPDLDLLQSAKLDVLAAAQEWYERGSQLALIVPALENIVAAADSEAAFLCITAAEQVLVDGLFDFDPPRALVDPGGNTAELLTRLRQCAEGLTSPDPLLRVRLACALADARLHAGSAPADVETAFAVLVQRAGAGRYGRAGSLVLARAAYAFATHGDTAHAIDLWRQGILLASESRRYGDVLACRRALNAAILEQPVPPLGELNYLTSLPNTDRLLAASQPAELSALEAVHAARLPDAFASTRRFMWETRLSGHLRDESAGMELLGDILLAARRPEAAVTAWVIGGSASKAADIAGRLAAPLEMDISAKSPVRARQAAVARVIGAQARLYGATAAQKAAHVLLDLTGGLWTERRIEPHPALDAVNALSRFGMDLPASAVDPVLRLVEPHLASGGALIPEIVELLIQLYWAVPGRREDLATVLGSQLSLADPPPHLWEMVSNLPGQAQDPLMPTVTSLADGGNRDALLTLAKWHKPTAAVQLAARRTAAHLLRQPAAEHASTWLLTTQFSDMADLLIALTDAETLTEVNPPELRPGIGPILSGKVIASITTQATSPSTSTDQAESGQEPALPAHPAAADDETGTVPGTGDIWEPDQPALAGAGPLDPLVAAIAEHLLAAAENSHAPAFIRIEALSALRLLIPHLPPELNHDLALRVLAIAENPAFSQFDEATMGSQDPLSRGRLNFSAQNLPVLALVMVTEAAAASTDAGGAFLTGQSAQRVVALALLLLRNTDGTAAKWGGAALARLTKYEPGLAYYAITLITHPVDDVRAVAAAIGSLDDTTQQAFAEDPSPAVRANLASRASELRDNVLAALQTDEHLDVKRALAAALPSDQAAPNT